MCVHMLDLCFYYYMNLGGYTLTHMDEFIDQLLREERVCDVILPRLVQRHILEDNDELEPRVSALEEDLESEEEKNDDDDD